MASESKPGILSSLRGGASGSAFSASLLLMVGTALSSVLALLRNKLIAHHFGAGPATDAYTAAFELPDLVAYLVIGGVASSTFIRLLNDYDTDELRAQGDRALSNIMNVAGAALLVFLVLGEILTPWYVRVKFHNFSGSEETARLCIHMTRMLLPNQLLVFAGGAFSSRLLVRKIFVYQAMQTSLYYGGIILGTLFLTDRFGISGVAMGAVLGAVFGFFLVHLFGAYRAGMRWSPVFDLRHPTLGKWLRLSIPLILGQSIVTMDQQIRTYFATDVVGGMSLMTYSRQLFAAPMNIVGPAAGLASLPFFASLWTDGNVAKFSSSVNRSVSRLMAVSLLLTGWMIALAGPVINLALTGGRFRGGDVSAATQLFIIFCVALVFWTSQNVYARAFYAAGDTLTPMISGTVVTVLSLPVYAWLFHTHGMPGLVVASNIAIATHMVALAVLLHAKRMVSLTEVQWGELGRALLAALASGFAVTWTLRVLPLGALLAAASLSGTSHVANFIRLIVGSAVWLAVVAAVLLLTKSSLPYALLRRGTKSASVTAPAPATAPDTP